MTTATASRFVIKGINDEQDSCSCCGKTGLKRVVWIEDTQTGDINFFGTSCATNPAKCFGVTKGDVAKAVRVYQSELAQKKNAEIMARHNAAYEYAMKTYTGGWYQKESELKPGMFFNLCVDNSAFEKLKRDYLLGIVQ